MKSELRAIVDGLRDDVAAVSAQLDRAMSLINQLPEDGDQPPPDGGDTGTDTNPDTGGDNGGDTGTDPPPEPPPTPLPGNIDFGTGVAYDSSTDSTIFKLEQNPIYVSKDGSDSQNGSSPGTAVATGTRALALASERKSKEIRVLSGPVAVTGHWSHFTTDQTDPVRLVSIGGRHEVAGVNLDRPTTDGCVAFVGLKLDAALMRATCGHITVERCELANYGELQASRPISMTPAGWWKSCAFRMNIICDHWKAANREQGLFVFGVAKQLFEGNLFDHNGWEPGKDRATARPTLDNHRMLSHNAYLQSPYSELIFRDNIVGRAASHGLHARNGGDVYRNIFVDNPINAQFGYYEGGKAYGSSRGTFRRNICLGSDEISTRLTRGVGLWIANVDDLLVEENVFAEYSGPINNAGCIYLEHRTASPIVGLRLVNNRSLNWAGPFIRERGDLSAKKPFVQVNNINETRPAKSQKIVDWWKNGDYLVPLRAQGVSNLAYIRLLRDSLDAAL